MINGFNELDIREFTVFESYNYKVILYQIDLLRIYNILKMTNSLHLAQKIKRIIFLKDYNNETKTDFNRLLPKSDVTKIILSPIKLKYYLSNQRELDQKLEIYYGKNKKN